jgi:acetyl esterase/lipase
MGSRWRTAAGVALAIVVLVVVAVRMRRGEGPSANVGLLAPTYRSLSLKSVTRTASGAELVADLYLPRSDHTEDPLAVVLQGNDPARQEEAFTFGGEVADTLQRHSIAALVLSFKATPTEPLRAWAAEAAKAIAEVYSAHPNRFSRVTLVGRGSGAWMAALLALDARLFEKAGFDAKKVAGVVGMRGTYDLSRSALEGTPDGEFFATAAGEADVSPIAFVRRDAPPFLLLSGADDDGAWPRVARKFALALERAGAPVEAFVAPRHDQHNLTQWDGEGNTLGDLVLSFVASGPKPFPIDTTYGVRQIWMRHPPIDNDAFRADPKAIRTYPVDAEFLLVVSSMLAKTKFELNILPGKTYEAIDLLDYLASRPESEVGKGDFLVVSNIRDERLYFSREDLVKTRPVIVVGMDDETNLFRIFTHYRLKQEYSWKPGPAPPMMIRPLGAFLHFRTSPPPALQNRSYAQISLTPKSFHWVEHDPLATVRDLDGPVRETMIGREGCVKCHGFRGVDARAHHALALDGKPHGAFALHLEEYPADVLRRFLFEQEAVARGFDVEPLRVDPAVARRIFELVRAEPTASK